jgi:hypothetical protein
VTGADEGWRVEHVALDVSTAHEADLTGPGAARLVRVHEITRPALVLGSTQRESDVVCFAGLGPGEVTRYGAKVVGISQRRTRHAARFQCAVLARWDVVGIATLLGLDRAAIIELAPLAAGVEAEPSRLVDAFVAALPS